MSAEAVAAIVLAVLVALAPLTVGVLGGTPAASADDGCPTGLVPNLLGDCAAATTPPATPTTPPAPPAPTWQPQLGPVFNDPLGKRDQQEAIVRRLIKAINHTPSGGLIRIAVYSFDRGDVLTALKRARKRHVRVQVIVNKSVMSAGVASLQKRLGKNPNKRNFVVACDGRCRGKGSGGNMHAKVYTFSQSGAARFLVITGSGNLTSKGVYRQWNDSFGVANDQALYNAWGVMFNQMAHQKQTTGRRLSYTSTTGGYSYMFERSLASQGSQASASQTTVDRYRPRADAAWRRIQQVSCAAQPGTGVGGHTVIRIAIYGMFGPRGEALAKALVAKRKQGCDIKVIMSVPGGHTYKLMERAGIPLRSGDWAFADRDAAQEDGISGWGPRFYSHLKFFAINGTYAGKPTRTVWTGSENWDSLSFANEEVVLTLNSASVYRSYIDKWNAMWNGKATHKMGIQPLVGPQEWYAGSHRTAS